MKLIEKKCPNCGASLEFNDTDKSCKCSYCHRSFEIERDNSNSNVDFAQQFVLNEVKVGLQIIPIIALVTFIIISGVVFYSFKSMHDRNNSQKNDFFDNSIKDDKKQLFTDANELENGDFEDIDNDAIFKISSTAIGNSTDHSFSKDGKEVREKVYVAYKDNSNYIISVYKVIYRDFFHSENAHTIYVPIQYENIKKNAFDKFKNPQVKAPEYYFNEEKTNYTYGYGSMDEIYSDLIKPLTDDEYKITEK